MVFHPQKGHLEDAIGTLVQGARGISDSCSVCKLLYLSAANLFLIVCFMRIFVDPLSLTFSALRILIELTAAIPQLHT